MPLALVACSRPSSPPKPAGFQVALLTPGPISDAGWNAGAYEGLKAVEKELGATVSHVQVKSPSEFEEQFRAYAARGTALCIGHGFEFQDAASRVAKEYPATVFVTTSGSRMAKNLGPIVFELEEATYLCGLAAGRMSRSAKAGMIGGVELPSIKSTFLAFEAGLKAGNPGASATAVFTGSFEDVAGAKTAALALADKGCDFLFQNADAAALERGDKETAERLMAEHIGQVQSALQINAAPADPLAELRLALAPMNAPGAATKKTTLRPARSSPSFTSSSSSTSPSTYLGALL